jgi:putative transcription factor
MFDDMEELATDYDERIRGARESMGLSQQELANELNEKTSLIRKLERGDVLPSDSVQRKLDDEDAEWSSDTSTTTTLGDVVKRKD